MPGASLEEAVSRVPPGKLRLAYSGGMDSSVLLYLVARRLAAQGELPRLTAHHMHHGLNTGADSWAEHCRETAEDLGVAFVVDRLELSRRGNVEQAARNARYERWKAVLARDETLLLAHHADDQAETLLMRLMRGGSGDLLKGIPRERRLGRGRLLRPLLHLPRSLLEGFASKEGLRWCEDPSNQDLHRDRNFVRHKILPLLASRWPESAASIASASESLACEFALLDSLLEESVGRVLSDEKAVSLDRLHALPSGLQLPVLRRALARIGAHSLSASKLEEVAGQSRAAKDRMPEFALGGGLSLLRYGESLRLHRTHSVDVMARHQWHLDEALTLPHGVLRAESGVFCEGACLCADIRQLEVGFRVGGERIRVNGNTKKVSRLMQEASIAPWLRRAWPLLYQGEDLLAAAGIAVDDSVVCDQGWLIRWNGQYPG